jgi:DNA-binding NtrC family response regulator
LFLDEIGDTTPATQVKLLRAIQEREVIPVGGTEAIKTNTRLIAATNRDLEEEVRTGNFRMDLYYRLNVIQIKLPSLRVRRDDIPLLVDHFLKKLCDGDRQVNREAMEILIGYDWPGNVRELENVIERAIILGDGGTIGVDDLPDRVIRGDSPRGSMVIDTPELTLDDRMAQEERLGDPGHQRLHPLSEAPGLLALRRVRPSEGGLMRLRAGADGTKHNQANCVVPACVANGLTPSGPQNSRRGA